MKELKRAVQKLKQAQSKTERREQLIRRAGTTLKCTSLKWRGYFFWVRYLLCKYLELIQR